MATAVAAWARLVAAFPPIPPCAPVPGATFLSSSIMPPISPANGSCKDYPLLTRQGVGTVMPSAGWHGLARRVRRRWGHIGDTVGLNDSRVISMAGFAESFMAGRSDG